MIKIFSSTNNNELILKFNSYFQIANLNVVDSNDNNKKSEIKEKYFDIWDKVLELIENEITDISYNTWIKTIKLINLENDTLILGLPSAFNLGIIESRYKSLIQNAINSVSNNKYKIKFLILNHNI